MHTHTHTEMINSILVCVTQSENQTLIKAIAKFYNYQTQIYAK